MSGQAVTPLGRKDDSIHFIRYAIVIYKGCDCSVHLLMTVHIPNLTIYINSPNRRGLGVNNIKAKLPTI